VKSAVVLTDDVGGHKDLWIAKRIVVFYRAIFEVTNDQGFGDEIEPVRVIEIPARE